MAATLKCDTIQNASSATANLTLDASGNATVGNTLAMGSSFKRNRIINGDMTVFQRGTAATTTDSYSVDRWSFIKVNDATESVSQNSDAPTGFSYSLRNTVSVADASIGASQYSSVRQLIEGYNVADLAYGTDNAKTITISFWVKATQTGTYCVTLYNGALTRQCWKQYTISASNTWEYKTLTFTGPNASVGGVWETTNSAGLTVGFYMALGSSFQGGTDGVWGSSGYYGPSGMTNGIGTNGNIYAITGVQLEVGSVATPYERQIYSEQLAQCQRYFQKHPCVIETSTTFQAWAYPVQMRTAPTISGGGAGFTDFAAASDMCAVYQTTRAGNISLSFAAEL